MVPHTMSLIGPLLESPRYAELAKAKALSLSPILIRSLRLRGDIS